MRCASILFLCLLALSVDAQDRLLERQEARASLRAGHFEQAARLYGALCEETPGDGALWEAFGLSLLRSGRPREAVVAYRRSIAGGHRPDSGHYNAACAWAVAGEQDSALAELRHAYAAGFANEHLLRGDDDLRSLHELAAFRELVGWPQRDLVDRSSRWMADLDFFERRLRELHWDPFRALDESEFERALDEIREQVVERDDAQLVWELRCLMARVGDGHTAVVLPRFAAAHGAGDAALLPLRFFWFDDQLAVVQTTPEWRSLCGAVVTRIGDEEPSRFLERLMAGVSSDNRFGARWMAMETLADPATQATLGNPELRFEFHLRDGSERAVKLPAIEGELVHAFEPPARSMGLTPTLAQTNPASFLWLSSLAEQRLLYVRMDRVADAPHRTLEAFAGEVADALADHDALVIDLRANHGGQGHLLQPLYLALLRAPQLAQPGRLYLLVGRETFSAAMAFAARLDRNLPVVFVGEPTGSAPNFVGESSLVFLPYSGIALSISSRYHQNGESNDQRSWIAPQLELTPTLEDFRSGRDAAMEALLAQWSAVRGREGVD